MFYEIVKYNPVYNDQVCNLEKANWGPDLSVNKSYLQWKYIENPYSDEPKLYLVLYEGKLVAVRGTYETIWQLGGSTEKFRALCMSDLAIQPEFRNKGTFPQLMNYVVKDLHDLGYRYLFNFSAGPINYIGSLAMGWKSIGTIKVLKNEKYRQPSIKNLIRNSAAIRFLMGTGSTRLRKIAAGRQRTDAYRIPEKLPPQLTVGESPKPVEMTALVNKLSPGNKITLSRDEEFFKWRYKNPLSEYVFLYWHDPYLKGYLVAQTPLHTDNSRNNYNVLELEGENPEIKIVLLSYLIKLMGSRTITVWSNTLESFCIDYLISKGFSTASPASNVSIDSPHVIIKATYNSKGKIDYKGVDLLDINNWDLKMTYSDNY